MNVSHECPTRLCRRDKYALVAVLIITILFFRKVIFCSTPIVLGSPILVDLTNQWYPWRLFGFGMLKKGIIPLWNPYCFCGYPFVANWQSAIFYPPNAVFLMLPVHLALNFSFVLHVFLCGAFTYAYMRSLTGDRISSLVSAITFMFSSQLITRIFAGHLSLICAMAWLPLELLMVDKGLRARTAGYFILCGAILAVQAFAGHPQMLFYSGITVLIYFLCRVLIEARHTRSVEPLLIPPRYLVPLAAVALGLAAVQILPCREFAACSSRQTMTYGEAAGASFPPENLATFLVPELFGDFVNARCTGRTFLWEASAYIGIFPLSLALLALFYRRNTHTTLFALIGAASFIIALGGYTPVLKFLFLHIPGFNLIRGNAKAFFITAYCLSFLAGIGCRLLKDELSPENKDLRRCCFVLLVLLVLLFAVLAAAVTAPAFRALCEKVLLQCKSTFLIEGEKPPPPGNISPLCTNLSLCARGACRSLIFMGLAAFVIGLRVKRYVSRTLIGILIAGATVIDLWSFVGRYVITSAEAYCWWPRDIVQFFKRDGSIYRTLRDIRVPVPGVNQNMNDGIYSFDGYETNAVARLKEFSDSFGIRSEEAAESMARPERNRFISLANIKYIIIPASVRRPFPEYLLRFDNGYVRVYENMRVMPRALIVHSAVVAKDPQEALGIMRGETFDPRTRVVLTEAPGVPLSGSAAPSPAEIVHYTPDDILIRCRLAEPGILLLSDILYPGWNVTVDGLPGRILRGDYAFRSVALDKGEHRVCFRYRPSSFRRGAWVSLLTLAACAIWGLVQLRRV